MNEPKLDQKIEKEVTQVKKAANTLKEDVVKKVSKVSEESYLSTEDVAAWVNSGVAQLSNEFEKVKGDATKTVAHAASAVTKNVGTGLSQYNAKAAEVVKKLPGGVGVKAGKYPWVAITFAFMAGFLLGGFLMPGRNCRD